MSKGRSPAPRAAQSGAQTSPRRRARELVLQGLYEWQLSGNDDAAVEAGLRGSDGFDRVDREFCVELLRGVFAEGEQLKEELRGHLDRPFGELSPIEASVLLVGAFELRKCPQTPYRVIINECIELAKTYGGTDGHKYVNGVLDKLAARLRVAEVEARRAARGRPG